MGSLTAKTINFRILKCVIWILIFNSFIHTTNGRCDPACQRGIDESTQYAATLHAQTTDTTDDLLKRVIHLENQNYDYTVQVESLGARLNSLEKSLQANVTALHSRISDEISLLWTDFTANLNGLRDNLENKIAEVRAIATNTNGMNQLYVNVTRRVDNLEFGTVRNLSVDNVIWRRNFRVINATFDRMRRNNCLC